ncbi:MAG: GNAT family N-acetyltransferase [Anaerolineae bacterium]
MIQCRPLQDIDEFEAAYNLEIAVWGIDPSDAVPVNLLRALQHGGSSLLGAYDGARMVGVALAFPARVGERWVLWSHLTGIDRAYQGQGVGFALKLYQRQWALDNGYDEIRWTFDPLQRGNAHFNLRRLGATAERYYVNFYGVMIDEINHANVPSDRVEAVWRLRDPRVEQLQNGEQDAVPDARRSC